jgi:hypothetical protein
MKDYIKKYLLKPFFYILLKRNEKFKNKYSGMEAYLFGDGISIKYFDLSYFSDKPSIPVSYIHVHKQSHYLNICFSIIHEPFYFYPYFKLPFPPYTYFKNNAQLMFRKFRNLQPNVPFFTNITNFPVFLGKNNYYLFDDLIGSDFTKELKLNGIKPFDGSVRTGIILAHYFGFKKIYMLGFDYTHNPSVANHFYEKGHGQIVDLGDHNKLFFQIANKYIDCVTITTNENRSNFLNSISYKEFTGAELQFKENIEIVDKSVLDIFNRWPDFNIY